MIHLFFLNLCAAIEAGPQPNGVVRADIYNMVKEAWELTLEWVQLFNSGRNKPVLACSNSTSGCGVSRVRRKKNSCSCFLIPNRKHV